MIGPRRAVDDAERGATAVEYALIVALVVAVLLTSVGFLQDRGTDKLEESDERIGLVDDNAAYEAPVGGGGPPATDPPPSGGGTMAAPAFTVTQAATDAGNRWNAFVTITVTDTSGTAVSGVNVAFTWSGGSSPNGECVTNASGQCVVSQSVQDNQPTVTVVVDEMTKESWTAPVPPSVASGPIACSPPLNAGCDAA